MRVRKAQLAWLVSAAILVLVGCQSNKLASPTPAASQVPETAQNTATPDFEVYLEPEAEIIMPYPETGGETTYPYPASNEYPYPGSKDEGINSTPSPYPLGEPEIYPNPVGEGEEAYPYPETDEGNTAGNENAYPDPSTAAESADEPYPAAEAYPAPSQDNQPAPTMMPVTMPTPIAIVVEKTWTATPVEEVELDSEKVQLIVFFAYWDGISKAMMPLVNRLELDYEDLVNFVHLDIDDPATLELKKILRYKTQPHFFLVDQDGKVLDQWIGFVDEEELSAAFDQALVR